MGNRGIERGMLGALATVLCALAFGAGCEGEDELTPKSETIERIPAATPVEPAPAEVPEPAAPADTAPADAAAADPDGSAQTSPADSAQGEQLYQQYCASCHGAGGRGDGPAGQALDPKPVSHADGTYMNNLSNEHLLAVIKSGGTAVGKSPLMPPWGGSLSDEQIRDVMAFVRTLAEPPYQGPMP